MSHKHVLGVPLPPAAQRSSLGKALLGLNQRAVLEVSTPAASTPQAASAPEVTPTNQLEQLAQWTVISVDTGDIDQIKKTPSQDATTNPLFVSQAGQNNDPTYKAFVDEAVAYAKTRATGDDAVELAIDRLSVNLGKTITGLVPGFVSTEVDPRLSFDTEETLRRALRIIEMYEADGIDRSRILIKVAGTWEGIQAAEALEKQGITTNITLVFSLAQAVAAAQRGCHLISPFVGRILDFYKKEEGVDGYPMLEDPGVKSVTRIYRYFKKYGHDCIVMGASWRNLDELRGLAGVDRVTVAPHQLQELATCEGELVRQLSPAQAAAECEDEEIGGGYMDQKTFNWLHNTDACGVEKLSAGIRAFAADTDKLEEVIRQHPGWN